MSKNGSEEMTHPDIRFAERYGYPPERLPRTRQIGVCLYCGSEIYGGPEGYVKSFDGLFCDMDCCHNYYEIDSREY